MQETIVYSEKLNDRASEIDKTLRLYEEIFPMNMTEIYLKHPKLDGILSEYRESGGKVDQEKLKVMEKALLDIKNAPSIDLLRKDIMSATNEIYRLIFPETGVEKFVRFCTEQKMLDDTQQLFLAPAKGIERAIGGIISLLNPQTYTELRAGTRYITGQSYDKTLSTIRTMYDQFKQMNSVKQASIGVEFLASSLFLFGNISKVVQVFDKYKALSRALGAGIVSQVNARDFIKISSFLRHLERV